MCSALVVCAVCWIWCVFVKSVSTCGSELINLYFKLLKLDISLLNISLLGISLLDISLLSWMKMKYLLDPNKSKFLSWWSPKITKANLAGSKILWIAHSSMKSLSKLTKYTELICSEGLGFLMWLCKELPNGLSLLMGKIEQWVSYHIASWH